MHRPVGLAVAAALAAALAALAPGVATPTACAASGPNRAAVLVEHGDGSVVGRCVAFRTASLTGEQLLNASGIAWSSQTFGGYGAAVCAIDGEPARYSSCPGATTYWAVYVARGGGAWQLTALGISTLTLADGDALGFRYVPTAGTPPVPVSAAGICAAATPTPAPATAMATPRSVATAAASAIPGASGSAGLSATPMPTGDASAAVTPGAAQTAAATGSPIPSPAETRPPGRGSGGSGGGPDPALLLAAVAGGGLGGLATVRLLAERRPAP